MQWGGTCFLFTLNKGIIHLDCKERAFHNAVGAHDVYACNEVLLEVVEPSVTLNISYVSRYDFDVLLIRGTKLSFVSMCHAPVSWKRPIKQTVKRVKRSALIFMRLFSFI